MTHRMPPVRVTQPVEIRGDDSFDRIPHPGDQGGLRENTGELIRLIMAVNADCVGWYLLKGLSPGIGYLPVILDEARAVMLLENITDADTSRLRNVNAEIFLPQAGLYAYHKLKTYDHR